jgi:hypothetical protein
MTPGSAWYREARVPETIGISGPLSGMQAVSIVFPGAVLAAFSLGAAGIVLSNLSAGNFAGAGAAGLLAIAFAALFARFLYDFIPQQSSLDGTVLAVERGSRQHQCDLATAEELRLGRTMPPLTGGATDAVPVLRARQHQGGPIVRLVLRGDDLRILPADQLLLLAEAVESGSAPSEGAEKVCRRLRSLADRQKPLPVLDWSFRTDPRGTRKTGK